MSRVGRLGGALLVESRGQWFLVGNPKEPVAFAAAGWRDPGVVDAARTPYVELVPSGPVDLPPPHLELDVEGAAVAELMADRMVIQRNASVSERLWCLALGGDDVTGTVDARWLAHVPKRVWDAVRDSVLRCR